MTLSDTKLRNAKPRSKQYKLMDDLGLYVLVKPNGSVLWRFDFQIAGKRKTLSVGKYPAITLKAAREERDKARELLDQGKDPTVQKKLDKITADKNQANTFGVVAKEYIQKQIALGRAEKTIAKKKWLLEVVAVDLADRPIAEIEAIEILVIMQRYEARGQTETANRLRSAVSDVFKLAVRTARATSNPAAILQGAVTTKKATSHAAITDEKKFGVLMANIKEYDGWPTVRYALEFIALTAVRPIECRKAEWPEFNLRERKWTIPAGRMKMRKEHAVPLSEQAVAVLEAVHRMTGNQRYVFASIRTGDKCLSENAMNSALRRMGYLHDEHVSHGFRSSFSTIMNRRKYDPEIIEHALAHLDTSVRGIYNRDTFWEARIEVMQAWADLIDELRTQKKDRFEELL
ncbi:integrase arm-type DNA-binding domain-containing protein [Rhizobium sp. AB2/73]|uniref:tyrosine-type recombinase/integrase n=1 Tax=Rhizobium sp. AB2/73 TaxID=2795216 RepID=UPI001C5DCF30|nr:integrase arm-type DNA-binding domain-containing protein [Rhizobium sp. AB2/73]QYA14082.1 tyrosine-type recombinase/integrase [Rhizobium sp. AB2/73]UEQ79987.1 tyrosine-type recombinase/integrase [Rhizobium sp. AB2/73]